MFTEPSAAWCYLRQPSCRLLLLVLVLVLVVPPCCPAVALYRTATFTDTCAEPVPVQLAAFSRAQCALVCLLHAPPCRSFTHESGVCRAFSGAPAGAEGGVFSLSTLHPVPTEYTVCADRAYRVLGPERGTDPAQQRCSVPAGGRLAVPLAAQQRALAVQLITQLGGEQVAQGADLDHASAAFIDGLLEVQPDGVLRYRSLHNGSLLNISAEVFADGQPQSTHQALCIDQTGRYYEYNVESPLMSLCEIPL